MRIAVYGGSFNPPHVGHALVAGWLRWTGRVDQVWLVPARAHPFGKEMAPFATRVALCDALAGAVGPWVETCGVEGSMDTPSYTIDTLELLARRHPGHSFQLVLGADNLDQLDDWKDWERIRDGFDPIVVGRQGYDAGPHAGHTIDMPGVSSTEVRRRLREGRPIDHLVPEAVRERLGDLYRGPSDTTP